MRKFQDMGRFGAIAAAAALVMGSAAPAAATIREPDTAATKQDDQSAPAAKKAKRYCIESEQTGSRMARKTCKTRDQWMKEDGFDPIGELNAN